MRAKILVWMATAALSTVLGSCSKDDNYPVDISFTNTPILINQSFQYQEADSAGTYVTISVSPTYFQVGVKITNNGSSTITVQSMTFTVDVPSTDSTGKTTITPSSCTISPSSTQSRTYLAEIATGDTVTIPGSDTTLSGTTVTSSKSYSHPIYCMNLPFADNASDQDFKTSGQLKLNGWQGPSTGATGRLNTAIKDFDFN
ncbi:MAG: hypothetical protein JST16_03450 [Bdellovibrionales bacterium]|nr:hypothetical protein [Bdellovibrionales bacterium]